MNSRKTLLYKNVLSDENGAVAIIVGASVIVLALFAFLAINYGISSSDQANLDIKLSTCTKYAAKELGWYNVRRSVKDKKEDERAILANAMEYTEEQALETLKTQYIEPCLLAGLGKGNFVNQPRVDKLEIEENSKGNLLLVATASVAQSTVLYGGDTRTNLISKTLLPWCRKGTDDCLPPDSKPPASALEFIHSYDQLSLQNLAGPMDTIMQQVKTALNDTVFMQPQNAYFGLQVGNIPAAVPKEPLLSGIKADRTELTGWSGGAYDNTTDIADFNLETNPKADSSRKSWPVAGFVYGQKTRRCEADPVWTYDTSVVGYCYVNTSTSCSGESSCCNSVPGRLTGTSLSHTIIDCSDGCIQSGNLCIPIVVNGTPQAASCTVENSTNYWTCSYQANQPVVEGNWYVSCPKTALTQSKMYKDVTEFLDLQLRYKKTISYGAGEESKEYPDSLKLVMQVPSSIGVANLLPQPHALNPDQSELQPLRKKNTERSWYYACEKPAGYNGNDGAYGRPFGGTDGISLVNSDNSDTAVAAGLNCRIPDPGASNVEYALSFLPDPAHCDWGQLQNCNVPEGKYTAWARIKNLLPQRGAGSVSAPVGPPGGKSTNVTSIDSNGWAWGGIQNVTNYHSYGSYTYKCPIHLNNKNVNSLLASYVGGPNGGQNIIGSIPAETFDIAVMKVEKGGRNADLGCGPKLSILEDFNFYVSDIPDNSQWYLRSKEHPVDKKACGTYPDFCECSGSGSLCEDPFWDMPLKGIGRFSANTGEDFQMGWLDLNTHPECGEEGEKSYCNYGSRIVNVNTVKKRDSMDGAQNVPITKGQATLDQIWNRLRSGYGDHNICSGHANNQGALFKAGARKAITLADNLKGKSGVVWIGSCPSNNNYTGAEAQYPWPFSTPKWNIFANSNISTGRPGEISGAGNVYLDAMNTPIGISVRQKTMDAFQNAINKLDFSLIITDDSCLDFAMLSKDGAKPPVNPAPDTPIPAAPGSFCGGGCVIPRDTPEHCAAMLLCAAYLEGATYPEVFAK